MDNKVTTFIPDITSFSGSALTTQNWQESGIHTGACNLSALLIKPGFDVLMNLPNLSTYFGGQQNLVLNAANLVFNQEDKCMLRSPYDGSKVTVTKEDVLTLIKKLAPTYLLLPPNGTQWIHMLPTSIFPFISWQESLSEKISHGIYIQNPSIDMHFEPNSAPLYVLGDLSFEHLKKWAKQGAVYLESDMPARDACEGLLYTSVGVISIANDEFKHLFKPIDSNCQCPTCQQSFTAAYLHHLYEQTPLLCQRLLIQHNVYYCQNMIKALVNTTQ